MSELNLHESMSMSRGIDLTCINPSPATLAYTDFLFEVASASASKVPEILAATAPCMRLYAFLGQQIQARFSARQSLPEAQEEWIKTYSSKDFEAAAQRLELLLDRTYAASECQNCYDRLSYLYHQAMILEYNFFDGQMARETRSSEDGIGSGLLARKYACQGLSTEQIALVMDFDSTCTKKDTTFILPFTAKHFAPNPEHVSRVWSGLESWYFQEYSKTVKEALAARTHDMDGPGRKGALEIFLKEVVSFENAAVRKVEESKVLANIPVGGVGSVMMGDLRGDWDLQDDCLEVIKFATENMSLGLAILSVSWSSEIIRTGLILGGMLGEERLDIIANDLVYGPDRLSTGNLCMRVEGAIGKAEKIKEVRNWKVEDGFSLYVGDSITDILAMLEADVGVWVGDSRSFREVAAAFDVKIRPLMSASADDFRRRKNSTNGEDLIVYYVPSWLELGVFLFGLPFCDFFREHRRSMAAKDGL